MNAFSLFAQAAAAGVPAVRAVVLAGPHIGAALCLTHSGERRGALDDVALEAAALPLMRAALDSRQTQRVTLQTPAGATELLIDITTPPPQLVIIGAVHTAIALVTFANVLGFRTIVLDARAAFATPARFGHAAELHIGWPADALPALHLDESSSVVVLTHDAKIDDPALAYALSTPARYIGALGSRKTHARRVEALRALGVADRAIARIHAPIGLDLGGHSPEEIALAIMAEVVAVRNGSAITQA